MVAPDFDPSRGSEFGMTPTEWAAVHRLVPPPPQNPCRGCAREQDQPRELCSACLAEKNLGILDEQRVDLDRVLSAWQDWQDRERDRLAARQAASRFPKPPTPRPVVVR